MWDHIINIHPNELLSTKTKEFRINESWIIKNKIFKKKIYNLHFIPNNILTKLKKKKKI